LPPSAEGRRAQIWYSSVRMYTMMAYRLDVGVCSPVGSAETMSKPVAASSTGLLLGGGGLGESSSFLESPGKSESANCVWDPEGAVLSAESPPVVSKWGVCAGSDGEWWSAGEAVTSSCVGDAGGLSPTPSCCGMMRLRFGPGWAACGGGDGGGDGGGGGGTGGVNACRGSSTTASGCMVGGRMLGAGPSSQVRQSGEKMCRRPRRAK
jgi:hypothetical protein